MHKDLGKKKSGNTIKFENVSGDVPFTELTSNQFVEGMSKIYDLELLIKLNSISFDVDEAEKDCLVQC